MNEQQLSQEILAEIEAKKIAPIPRWRFSLQRLFFWVLAILALLIAGIAAGVALFLLLDLRRHNFGSVPHDLTEILIMIPFVWLAIVALLVVVARQSFKQTSRGYRYELWLVLLVSVLACLLLGLAAEWSGLGEGTHHFLNRFSLYGDVTYDAQDAWSQPLLGRLAGTVLTVQGSKSFSLIDFNGRLWQVRLATSAGPAPVAREMILMSGLYEASSSFFLADCVYDWDQPTLKESLPVGRSSKCGSSN